MNNDLQEPETLPVLPTGNRAEPDSSAIATDLEDSFFETRRFREGGWDGPSKALFIGTLAETGVVTFACRSCQMSAKSAYSLRHRDPIFSKAWEAALDMARHRLADELLARSLKGSAEQLLRDGCIVGERHHYDNKLAFAILRRLDRQAELGSTFRTPSAMDIPAPAPAVSGQWQDLLDALGEDRMIDASALLAPAQHEQGNSQGNNPPVEGVEGDELDEPFEPKRVWQDWKSEEWRTNFPPPPGFDGEEDGAWEDVDYTRTLTTDEHAALAAAGLADTLDMLTIEEDVINRDAFFAALVPAAPDAINPEVVPRLEQHSTLAEETDTTRPKPPKSEPPLTPSRSKRGNKDQGENP